MLFAYEDKRFADHPGVDAWAMLRAAMQMAGSGRIVSGGSTLTMQVARLIEPRTERSFSAKWRQAARAIDLERRYTKREILELYLALAPFGGNIEGVRAASLAYFARSQNGSRSARRRCLWRCLNHPFCAGPTSLPVPRASPATGCSTGLRLPA